MDCHRSCGLNNRILFFTVLEAWSPIKVPAGLISSGTPWEVHADSCLFSVSSQTERVRNLWYFFRFFSSVQSLSCVQLFATPWTAVHQASLSITNSGAWSNSCPAGQWWHATILSSVIPFSSCLQSFPASGSFPMSQFFASGSKVLESQLQH